MLGDMHQERNPSGKPKGKGTDRNERKGMDKEGTDREGRKECFGNLLPHSIKYPQQSGSAFPLLCFVCKPFKVLP